MTGIVPVPSSPREAVVEATMRLAADRPCLLEFVTDPEVPPLPPDIRFEQAKGMAKALAGDPARGKMIRASVKDKLAEFMN